MHNVTFNIKGKCNIMQWIWLKMRFKIRIQKQQRWDEYKILDEVWN